MCARPVERYHHGNLREALLTAAETSIRERGLEAVTLRSIARSAGVSHAAPYHHFASLEDLLAAVAASGFSRLRHAMLEGAADSRELAPLERLQGAGVAYVGFAVANPHLYRLMFSGRLQNAEQHGELAKASAAAYKTLGGLLASSVPGQSRQSGSAATAVQRAAWALVHGLAMLLIDGRLDVDPNDPEHIASTVRDVTTVLGRGLRNLS